MKLRILNLNFFIIKTGLKPVVSQTLLSGNKCFRFVFLPMPLVGNPFPFHGNMNGVQFIFYLPKTISNGVEPACCKQGSLSTQRYFAACPSGRRALSMTIISRLILGSLPIYAQFTNHDSRRWRHCAEPQERMQAVRQSNLY
ncbi:MAG: hypothetical protein JXR65_07495 [Bacteroidales bacterium]|nr:hypothetical protein [Bacteroidales bacterium]